MVQGTDTDDRSMGSGASFNVIEKVIALLN